MQAIQVVFFTVFFLLLAFILGTWLLSVFHSNVREFTRVVPISAYVDSDGDFLICVRNNGPNDYYGVLVVSSSGKSVDVQLYVKVGEVAAAKGSLGGVFVPGTQPVIYVVTGGGSSYPVVPVVVPDISSVSCK